MLSEHDRRKVPIVFQPNVGAQLDERLDDGQITVRRREHER